METTVPFGVALRAYRLAAGLTQETLAERAGVSPRTIQALEREENTPHKDTLERLAAALGLVDAERRRFLDAVIPVPRRRSSLRTRRSQAFDR